MNNRNPVIPPQGNATKYDVVKGAKFTSARTGYVAQEGNIKDKREDQMVIDSDEAANGKATFKYTDGDSVLDETTKLVAMDENFIPGNIKKDVTIFGMKGTADVGGGGGTGGNAQPGDVIQGKTFTNDEGQQSGRMVNYSDERIGPWSVTPDDRNPGLIVTPETGYYDDRSGIILTELNFKPENIKKGVSLFGMSGTAETGMVYRKVGISPISVVDNFTQFNVTKQEVGFVPKRFVFTRNSGFDIVIENRYETDQGVNNTIVPSSISGILGKNTDPWTVHFSSKAIANNQINVARAAWGMIETRFYESGNYYVLDIRCEVAGGVLKAPISTDFTANIDFISI
ncbi:hypothetical protein [Paenibacillus sp. GCM10027626]|uniref:hypothetical protein n=1 Tax=Paenibacillus sp. GCM10027626 TaxID=3273411 RepID=UPI003637BB99